MRGQTNVPPPWTHFAETPSRTFPKTTRTRFEGHRLYLFARIITNEKKMMTAAATIRGM